MKEKNLIILIVGIILIGLLLISGISNINFNTQSEDNSIQTPEINNDLQQETADDSNKIDSSDNTENSNDEKIVQDNPSEGNNT